ncbi:MAG TPA: hypothetical protein VI434_11285 [Candidatus Dormibacteraeota bacterium]
MPISDDRPDSVSPPPPPPSFVRRHPILAGFGVLSALSLFSALWPASAIVVSVAIAADATGLDRKAWSLTTRVAERIATAVRGREQPDPPSPAPVVPAPSAPQPSAPVVPAPSAPQPSAPRRDLRAPQARSATPHAPRHARQPRKSDLPVETRVNGRGL